MLGCEILHWCMKKTELSHDAPTEGFDRDQNKVENKKTAPTKGPAKDPNEVLNICVYLSKSSKILT